MKRIHLWHSGVERLKGSEIDLKEYMDGASIICIGWRKKDSKAGSLTGTGQQGLHFSFREAVKMRYSVCD